MPLRRIVYHSWDFVGRLLLIVVDHMTLVAPCSPIEVDSALLQINGALTSRFAVRCSATMNGSVPSVDRAVVVVGVSLVDFLRRTVAHDHYIHSVFGGSRSSSCC
jgi:hypothetical protein